MDLEQRLKQQLGELLFTCNSLAVQLEQAKAELEKKDKNEG